MASYGNGLIQITGIDENIRGFRHMRNSVDRNIEQVIDEAIERFIDEAKSEVPVDKGNLRDSIKVLDRKPGSVQIGVDLKHEPATRRKPGEGVGAYSPYVISGPFGYPYDYLDYAQYAIEDVVVREVKQVVDGAVREKNRSGVVTRTLSAIGRAVGSVGRIIGSFFGR